LLLVACFLLPQAGAFTEWQYSNPTALDIYDVELNEDGQYLAASTYDGKMLFFNTSSSTPVWIYEIEDYYPINSVALSYDGQKAVYAGDNGLIYFFDTTSGTPLWTYDAGPDDPSGYAIIDKVEISAGGDIVVAVADTNNLYVLDSLGTLIAKHALQGRAYDIDISGNGEKIAVGMVAGEQNTWMYLYSPQEKLWDFNTVDHGWGGAGQGVAVTLSYNGDVLAIAAKDNKVYYFNTTSETPLWDFEIADDDPAYSIEMSADGKFVTCTGDGKLFLLNGTSGKKIWQYSAAPYLYNSIFGAPNVYPNSNEEERTLWSGSFRDAVGISDDGKVIFCAGYLGGDIYSLYYQLDRPFRKYNLDDDGENIGAISVSADGAFVAAAGLSGSVKVWEVAPAELIEIDIPISFQLPGLMDALGDLAKKVNVTKMWETLNTNSSNTWLKDIQNIKKKVSSGDMEVDVYFIKTGKARKVNETWRQYFMSWPVPFMPVDWLSPDAKTNETYDLPEGTQDWHVKKTLKVPQLLSSQVSNIMLMLLRAHTYDDLYQKDSSDDTQYFIYIQVGYGNPFDAFTSGNIKDFIKDNLVAVKDWFKEKLQGD